MRHSSTRSTGLARLTQLVDAARQDTMYALRGFRRAPGMTAVIVLTLALGVGANAALFAVADRLFLRPPEGVADPESLRRMYVRSNWSIGGVTEMRDQFSYPAFAALRATFTGRARTVAYTPPDSVGLGEGEARTIVRATYAAADVIPLLGVHPALGRLYTTDEDRMGAGQLVAVIGHSLWRRKFAGDSGIIGRAMMIARQRYTIVGVLPEGFTGIDLESVDAWLPLSTYPAPLIGGVPWYANWRSGFQLRVLVRVASGTSDGWLSSAGTPAYRLGEREGVQRGADTTATVLAGPLLAALGPSIAPTTEVAITTRLVGVVIIVLLIACANVANLLLARGLRRRREFAVRLAIGMSRQRLAGQLLVEGLAMAFAAAGAALVVAQWGGTALQRVILPEAQWTTTIISWRLIGVTIALALATGVLASLVPVVGASRPDLTRDLRAGARGNATDHSRLRATLVVVQAAFSVILLAGAGLFVRSLSRAQAIELGYDADRLMYATVRFVDPVGHFLDRSSAHQAETVAGLRDVASRLARMPGVERTAMASAPPMAGFAMIGLSFENGVAVPRLEDRDPALVAVTPDYFAAVGIRALRGRLLTEADNAGAERVLLVNETTARAYWPGADPIGRCLHLFRPTEPCARVIGVVRDSHLSELVETPKVMLFVPTAQQRGSLGSPNYLIIRASPVAMPRVAAEVRRLVRDVFPGAEPPGVSFVSSRIGSQLRPWRLGAAVFAGFGVLALLVAGVGVYSVVSYSVGQRTHEMGVRIALGARRGQVMAMVIGEGVRTVFVGIALGALLALGLGRMIASMLYSTSPHDPAVLALVVAVLGAVAALACAVPAWRASTAHPANALRAE